MKYSSSQPRSFSHKALFLRGAALSLLFLQVALGTTGCDRSLSQSVGERVTTQHSVPLQVVEGPGGAVLALVPIFIKGQGPFAFALDTGASQSLVDLALVEQLDLPDVGRTRDVTGIVGASEATLIRVEEWRVGEVPLPATTAITLDLPGPNRERGLRGLLGSDMLSQFGAITIDYEHEILILHGRR